MTLTRHLSRERGEGAGHGALEFLLSDPNLILVSIRARDIEVLHCLSEGGLDVVSIAALELKVDIRLLF